MKFLENLQKYISLTPEPVSDSFVDRDGGSSIPLVRIDDIEILCVHYNTCAEAITKWEQRKRRINFDKIFVIANTWDLDERKDLVDRINNLGYKTIILTTNTIFDYYPNCHHVYGNFILDEKNNPTPSPINYIDNSYLRYFERDFDWGRWLFD